MAEAWESSFDQGELHTGNYQIALYKMCEPCEGLVHVLITVIFPPLSTMPGK